MSVFGFSTEPSAGGGDFTPIIKYDSRSGRIFRIDRVQTQDGFVSEPVDITAMFKAICDFEHIECGWIAFPANSPPSFALVPMGMPLPERPSENHKNGIRFRLKLNKTCGGDKPVREVAGTAKAMLSGIEQVYTEYDREKGKYAGKLPVLVLASTTPVKSGSGSTVSTNYRPTFRIDGWAPRPVDLPGVATITSTSPPTQPASPVAPAQPAPSTGRTVASPPVAPAKAMAATVATADDNDFG